MVDSVSVVSVGCAAALLQQNFPLSCSQTVTEATPAVIVNSTQQMESVQNLCYPITIWVPGGLC